jgi:hypothetical protein
MIRLEGSRGLFNVARPGIPLAMEVSNEIRRDFIHRRVSKILITKGVLFGAAQAANAPWRCDPALSRAFETSGSLAVAQGVSGVAVRDPLGNSATGPQSVQRRSSVPVHTCWVWSLLELCSGDRVRKLARSWSTRRFFGRLNDRPTPRVIVSTIADWRDCRVPE